MSKVYILSATQISLQEPLSEAWMKVPVRPAPACVPCQDPDFKQFIPPMQARRMGTLLKRALVTAQRALDLSGIVMPDAVLCGTARGCAEPTDHILASFAESGEGSVSPTDFMQSTHNTVASAIAIHLKCHGYNCTYSQGCVSFESALLDAFLQLKAGLLSSALVCAAEDTVEFSGGEYPASALSVAMFLSNNPEGALCELSQVQICHGFAPEVSDAPVLEEKDYKPLFGDNAVSGAAGLYMGAHLLDGQPLQVLGGGRADFSRILILPL